MESKFKPYLLLFPVSIVLIFIMGICIINCISQSLGYFPQIGLNNFTLDYYKEILSDRNFLESLIFSLKTSFISSSICIIVGVFLAYILSKEKY